MENDELKELVDGLFIKVALQEVQIQQLTAFVFELMHRVEGLNTQTTQHKIDFAESLNNLSVSELDEVAQFLNNPKQVLRSKMQATQNYESLIHMLKGELKDLS